MTSGVQYKDTLIKVQDVCLSFNGVPILNHVNAEVKDIVRPDCVTGQIVGILGPSGVGKTQLSRILTGLQAPTSGQVLIGPQGKPVTSGVVGFVAQNYPLLRHRTILENLILAGKRTGKTREESKSKAEEYLRLFQLHDKWDVYPSQLSGGQRQRVAIAQQLLCSENYLVLDEPTTGLDPIMRDKVCDFITKVASLHEENTIFVISHDIPSVLSIADTVWLMGRTWDPSGIPLGSQIVKVYNLVERGLAWEKNPSAHPAFASLLTEIRQEFENL